MSDEEIDEAPHCGNVDAPTSVLLREICGLLEATDGRVVRVEWDPEFEISHLLPESSKPQLLVDAGPSLQVFPRSRSEVLAASAPSPVHHERPNERVAISRPCLFACDRPDTRSL